MLHFPRSIFLSVCVLSLLLPLEVKAETYGPRGSFPMPPDSRPRKCPKQVQGDFSDHKVSVIIPWHKEKWQHLQHTTEALLHFTPDELLEEIIFISDGNSDPKATELKAMSPKIKVFSFKNRQGLIRAKSYAVKKASAPVLMFMESHCIVNRYWLEPLLERLKKHPKAIVMPTLDHIPQDDWNAYFPGRPIMWRFEWNMNLVSTNPGNIIKDDRHVPFESPGTSGGIFVMRKDWFADLEFFDEGMLEWGGDHVELSFKTWRCGGSILTVPCSRIGHLFRDPSHRPYPVEVDQVVKNYDRLARIWWGKEHYKYFRRMKPEAKGMKHKGMDKVKESHARLHEKFQCKDHQWYLENVDFEANWEKDFLCHPHIQDPKHRDYCRAPLASPKFTVAQGDEMPPAEYKRVRKAAKAKHEEEVAAAADDASSHRHKGMFTMAEEL